MSTKFATSVAKENNSKKNTKKEGGTMRRLLILGILFVVSFTLLGCEVSTEDPQRGNNHDYNEEYQEGSVYSDNINPLPPENFQAWQEFNNEGRPYIIAIWDESDNVTGYVIKVTREVGTASHQQGGLGPRVFNDYDIEIGKVYEYKILSYALQEGGSINGEWADTITLEIYPQSAKIRISDEGILVELSQNADVPEGEITIVLWNDDYEEEFSYTNNYIRSNYWEENSFSYTIYDSRDNILCEGYVL